MEKSKCYMVTPTGVRTEERGAHKGFSHICDVVSHHKKRNLKYHKILRLTKLVGR